MSAEHQKQLNSKKTKRKRPKLPFLSFTELQEWSRSPFTESIGPVLADLQALIDSQCQLVGQNPLANLASLFNSMQTSKLIHEQDKLTEEVVNNDLYGSYTQFVNQSHTMGAKQYIKSIVLSKQVPLKPQSNHDLFNASMWLALPKTRFTCAWAMYKSARSMSPDALNNRSHLEDRFTLFDESGVALISDDLELIELINKRAWKTLFYESAERCQKHLRLWIVGHGLYEQLLVPYIGLVAYGRCYHVDSSLFQRSLREQGQYYDQMIAHDLRTKLTEASLELSAIPILGYPNWWAQQNAGFYDNTRYFRGPYPR